jgi:hypothetical protein
MPSKQKSIAYFYKKVVAIEKLATLQYQPSQTISRSESLEISQEATEN